MAEPHQPSDLQRKSSAPHVVRSSPGADAARRQGSGAALCGVPTGSTNITKTIPPHDRARNDSIWRTSQKFVVKPTHGSAWVQIVSDKSLLDRAALIETCTGWLNQSYYEKTRVWFYKHIEPRIIVEEFIDDGTGAAPNDYKLFVFSGIVEMIQVDVGRFTDHRGRLYSPAWRKLDVRYEYNDGYNDVTTDVPPPPHLTEMIASAEALGRDLDFIRADFYDTAEGFYLGELTSTPGRALARFIPKEYDHYLGRRWKLPTRRAYAT
jgi:hypothetical protein